jgi:hypothetical protein
MTMGPRTQVARWLEALESAPARSQLQRIRWRLAVPFPPAAAPLVEASCRAHHGAPSRSPVSRRARRSLAARWSVTAADAERHRQPAVAARPLRAPLQETSARSQFLSAQDESPVVDWLATKTAWPHPHAARLTTWWCAAGQELQASLRRSAASAAVVAR